MLEERGIESKLKVSILLFLFRLKRKFISFENIFWGFYEFKFV